MTGYCKFCYLRLDTPYMPPDPAQSDAERSRAALVGLGLVAIHHLAKEHARQLAGPFASLASIEALVACFCLSPNGTDLVFEQERDRLKGEIMAWLSQPELIQFKPAACNPPILSKG